MSEELIKLLRENNITIVNDIMDKRNGSRCVGYHLRSPSIKNHKHSCFLIYDYMERNNFPYSITDGSNNKDIFLHIN